MGQHKKGWLALEGLHTTVACVGAQRLADEGRGQAHTGESGEGRGAKELGCSGEKRGRLHGGYMAATWRLHGSYMAVTWREAGAVAYRVEPRLVAQLLTVDADKERCRLRRHDEAVRLDQIAPCLVVGDERRVTERGADSQLRRRWGGRMWTRGTDGARGGERRRRQGSGWGGACGARGVETRRWRRTRKTLPVSSAARNVPHTRIWNRFGRLTERWTCEQRRESGRV